MRKSLFMRIILPFLLLIIALPVFLKGETVKIPGNPTLLSRYIDFYYNFPTKDFIYHLNDLLIFSEAPTDKIIKRGIREKVA
ncbi:MAG: hypothetical protein ABFR75_07295, partial [Acidobacteriota bacterium]